MSTAANAPNIHDVLTRLNEITEIRDEKGNVLGVYTPMGKSDSNGSGKHVLIVFDDGASVHFDLNRARETLAREKDQGRPFREIIAELENRARMQ